MTVTIKIYFSLPSGKQEIRRFTTDAPAILPALLSFLHATYSPHYQPPLKFSIAYDDDEDLIAVNSEEELREGLSLHAASGAGGVFKLLCSFDQSAASGLASPSGLASGTSTPASLSGLPTFPASPSVSVVAKVETSAPIVTEPTDGADEPSERDEADDGEIVSGSGSDSDAEYVRLEAEADEPLSARAESDTLAASEGSQSASQTLVADLFQAPEPVADKAGAASAPPSAEPEVETEAAASPAAPAVTVEDVTAADETADAEPETEAQPQTPVAEPEPAEAEEAQAEPSPAPVAHQQPAAVHPHVVCDGCSQNPIVGTRFHCRSCRMPGGFDFCGDCHRRDGSHPASHSFVAYATPEAAAAAESDAFTPDQQDCLDLLQALSAKITRVMDGAAAEEAQEQSQSAASASGSSSQPPAHASASASASAFPASSRAAPSHSSGALAVHRGITCDGCGQSPLLGNRYHCTAEACAVPGGFDLCEPCEESGARHPGGASHVMLKMRVPGSAAAFTRGGRRYAHGHGHGHGHCPFRPAAGAAGGSDREAQRPKAEFISDVTVSDGLQVHAGETLRKVWSVRNCGPGAWPAGTRLVFVGGDLAPESEGRADAHGALVPFAGPGAVVHVAIDIVVPQAAGRFRATFRLQTPHGLRFGPRIWIDLTVPEEQKHEPEPEAEPEAEAEAEAPREPAAVAAALPVAVPESAAAAPEPEPEPELERAAGAAAAESKQAEEELEAALAAELAAAHIAAPVPNSAAAPGSASSSRSSPAAAAAVPAPTAAAASFAYSNQLAVLRGMGFADRELCKYLLLNNRGDLEKVVTWLLANAK